MVSAGENTRVPEVGQLLYSERKTKEGVFEHSNLFFIDTPPKNGSNWMVTWIAQMEDYGKGIEVYVQPASGGSGAEYARIATDRDINSFIECILDEGGHPQHKLREWLDVIKFSPECEMLKASEKERLVKLISAELE